MYEAFLRQAEHFGFAEAVAKPLYYLLALAVLGVLAWLTHVITRQVLLGVMTRLARRAHWALDGILVRRRLFHRLAHIAPAIVVSIAVRLILADFEQAENLIQRFVIVYSIIVGLFVVSALFDSLHDVYRRYPISRRVPVKGFLQAIMIIIVLVGVISIISVLFGKEPSLFLGGLGAMTAVLMLIFRDPILGFVAGIQLSANDMVRPGDWIEMPRYEADGDVIDVSLTTVKVQNWDKTITTIPAYALISESFRNWRGMTESGGRRIMRSIRIDISSVRFLDREDIEHLRHIQLLRDYLERKERELEEYNAAHEIDGSVKVNGRRLTNLGTFRAYVTAYLRHHPKIHQDMIFLIRHLQPTETGLPLEVYVFCRDQAWVDFEGVQADIFDHLLAALPEFGLRAFQNPSGGDVAALAESLKGAVQGRM